MADTPAHYPDITTKPRTIIMLAGIIGFKFWIFTSHSLSRYLLQSIHK
jgi:hypothetical protein